MNESDAEPSNRPPLAQDPPIPVAAAESPLLATQRAGRALRTLVRGEIWAPLFLVSALISLPIGLCLPLLEVEKMWFWQSSYSVLSGISGLWKDGQLLLALVLLCFSVLFPFVKLGALVALWFRRMDAAARERLLERLEWLGRWSMLDVFAVAILVVAAKLGILAECHPQQGVYVFGAAVLCSMLANARLLHLARGLRAC
jgi:paraquat-inducible protein A